MADRYQAMTDQLDARAWDAAAARYAQAVFWHGSGSREALEAWTLAQITLDRLVEKHAQRVSEAARAVERQVAG